MFVQLTSFLPLPGRKTAVLLKTYYCSSVFNTKCNLIQLLLLGTQPLLSLPSHQSRHFNWSLYPQRTVKHYSRPLDEVYQLIEPHVLQKDQEAIRDQWISGEDRNRRQTKKHTQLETYPGCLWGAGRSWYHLRGDKEKKTRERRHNNQYFSL